MIKHLTNQRRALFLRVGAFAVATVLAGCSAPPQLKDKINSFNQPVNLANAQFMPSAKQLSNSDRRMRVVVFQPDEHPTVRGIGLPEVAVRDLENQLGKGGVEVVDRNLAASLDKELKLAEMNSSRGYAGPDVADFAVKMVMGNASAGSRYIEASSHRDKKGNVTYTPASWTHSGQSAMTVRVYEIPSLRLVESLDIDGNATVSDQRSDLERANWPAMMRAATQQGVRARQAKILDEFAPRGYVDSARSDGKMTIFKITLGKRSGVKPGNGVEIYSLRKSEGGLRGDAVFEEVLVAKATVSDQVADSECWVEITDEKSVKDIRRGDIARIKYDKGTFRLPSLPKLF